jgi:hypothetical protein
MPDWQARTSRLRVIYIRGNLHEDEAPLLDEKADATYSPERLRGWVGEGVAPSQRK